MNISLSKDSDVPVHEQLAEQIVFLITTGKLRPAEQLPSVRALARRLAIHHNTVSKAYHDLVQREWLRRRKGSRLCVAPAVYLRGRETNDSLDELIDRSTERAREMGYSLATLRKRVAQRLALQPPDHFLVVEEESGLRKIIQAEIYLALKKRVEGCTPQEFSKNPGLTGGAQVLVPEYAFPLLAPVASSDWPPIRLMFSTADEHVKLIKGLKEASTIAVVSVSESVLKTARSVFAGAIERRHTFREVLVRSKRRPEVRGVDVVFCDSLAMRVVTSRRKIHYQLLTTKCMAEIAAILDLWAFPIERPRGKKRQSKLTD